MKGGFIGKLDRKWSIIVIVGIVAVIVLSLGLGLGLGLKPKPSAGSGSSSNTFPYGTNAKLKEGNASVVTAVSLQNARVVTHPLGPYTGQQSELIIDAVPTLNIDGNFNLHCIAEVTRTGGRTVSVLTSVPYKAPPGNLVVDISGTDALKFQSAELTVWIESPDGTIGPKTSFRWPLIS